MVSTKRQKQKEQTRLKIIDTAYHLYSLEGFSTPTNVIAQKAGISHGTIFVHFPTCEELQLSVLRQFVYEIGNKLHNLSCINDNISELLYAHIDVLEEYEQFYKKLISQISILPSESKMLLLSMQSTMSEHFLKILEPQQQLGKIKDIPLHMLFNAWIGLLYYYLQNGDLFAPGKSVLKKCRNELVQTYIKLISN